MWDTLRVEASFLGRMPRLDLQTEPRAERRLGSSVSILGILSTFGIPKWGGKRFGRRRGDGRGMMMRRCLARM